ncbi:putative epoxide hydrolase [Mollisia scopiformis]|uniref:Putative epoxide hydrolase n=1 Tax=Mollisia scopiformis TaxID=149040 RepID=A0A194WU40_MOLSC|nr:putative epoxide hydrolase [Mollisia scopiformis]KUJ11476.1 putative epoxide hydrolase [Mollisia scopiformis]
MATIAFPDDSKVVKLPSGANYSYAHIPAKAQNPTVLFLHGFPSSSFDWRHQVTYFSSHGFGVIAPDLLAYGETEKPTTLADYRGKKMAAEINELLDHVEVSKVHGVGHDWGSFMLSRFANYYPERFFSCSFLAVPYIAPGRSMSADPINVLTKQKLGYEMYGYRKFFEKEDAAQILKAHIESFLSLLYPAEPSIWREHIAPLGAVEAFATSDRIEKRGAYVTDEEMATHRRIMKDDYGPAMNWYKCAGQDLNLPDEQNGQPDPKLDMPALMIVAKEDPLSNALAINAMREHVTNLKVVEYKSGHWVQIEKKDEVNSTLEEFFRSL